MNRLPSDVVSALRTDVTITSAPQCVTELVLNSIDAKATSIAVRVDLNLFKIQVVDNGCGISQDDLNLLGIRYMTSKCHSLNDLRSNLSSFGFRGEALASLCEVAGTVMITSRPAGSDNTYCKIVTQRRHQKVVRSSRPRPGQGTTILIGDFLYNRLVRRARIKAAFDMEEIKTHLENIALIHPQVSLSLRDDSSGQIILETRKSNSIVDTFSSLFGPAIAETLCPVKERSNPFEVSGYISKEAYAHKNLQFIYINKRIVLKSKLHKLVNSIMGRSAILKVNNVPQNPISKELNSAFFLAMSPPKRAKHAVYILNVTCPFSEYDITLDPQKTLIEFRNWDVILNCFEKLLRNFVEPQVSPESPVKGSSVLDEINRLAREDAMLKGGGPPENLGTRLILGMPARRDAVTYTPPSQYTQESTVVSSEGEISTLLTSNSEDPFPAYLRRKAPCPSVSSEAPFPAERPPNRNHDFDTTLQDDVSTVSTKDFLTMFKQPVFRKKLKRPETMSKLPVGDSVQFDLNLQSITNMFRPVGLANDVNRNAAERRKRSVCDSLQRFSHEKSVQSCPSTNDTARYHTPENSQRPSPTENALVDTLPDLPFMSDLETRPVTLSDCVTPQQTAAQPPTVVHPENTEKNAELNLDICLVNERISSPSFPLNSDSECVETAVGELQNNLQPQTLDNIIEKQTENLPRTSKVFMSSEDFLVTREDMKKADDLRNTSATSSQADMESLSSSTQGEDLDALIELLQTDFDCGQSAASSVEVLPAAQRECDHHESSEEFSFLNVQQSLSFSPNVTLESETKESDSKRNSSYFNQMKDLVVLPVNSDDPSTHFSGLHSDQNCEHNLPNTSGSTTVSDLFLKPFEPVSVENNIFNPRKRNADKDTIDLDVPLKKMASLEKSSFTNFENTHVDTPRKNDSTNDLLENSTNCGVSPSTLSSSGMLKRHCVVLDCSIAGLSAVLSPRQSRILNKDRSFIEETELVSDSQISKSNAEVETGRVVEQVPNETSRVEETGKCDDATEELKNMETEEESSKDLQNPDELPFSSSHDGSLLAVYEQAMLEISDTGVETAEVAVSNSEVLGQDDTPAAGSDKSDVWEERTDDKGRKYFVHSRSGAIRFEQDSTQGFTMEKRSKLFPEVLSSMVGNMMPSEPAKPISTKDSDFSSLLEQDGLATAKWPNGKPGRVPEVVEKPWRFVDQLLTTFEPGIEAPMTSALVQDQTLAQIKVYNVCYPYTFTKDIFSNIRVLGQLDSKFIVTIAKVPSPTELSDVVILFDQHAVHERIRVEQLTKEYREIDEGIVWRSAPVHPALPLSLSAREIRVMTNCPEKLRALGLRFSKTDSHSIRITGVPTCLLLREDREVHGRGVSVLKSHLESLIREEVEALIQTRGAGVEQPAIIRNVIASEACRGAVKFGHPLETEDCRAFLHNLSSCDLPFQCAHGRPALSPVADLNHLTRPAKLRKPNLWKLRRS